MTCLLTVTRTVRSQAASTVSVPDSVRWPASPRRGWGPLPCILPSRWWIRTRALRNLSVQRVGKTAAAGVVEPGAAGAVAGGAAGTGGAGADGAGFAIV